MSSSSDDDHGQGHGGDVEEEKKPLKLRSCSNYGLPPIKPPKKNKKKEDKSSITAKERDKDVPEEPDYEEKYEEYEEEEEEISTPFRSDNRKSGKPSLNSISSYTKADKNGKTVKKKSKYLMSSQFTCTKNTRSLQMFKRL